MKNFIIQVEIVCQNCCTNPPCHTKPSVTFITICLWSKNVGFLSRFDPCKFKIKIQPALFSDCSCNEKKNYLEVAMTFTHFCKCVKYQIITFASHNKDLTKKFVFSAQLDSHTEILFMQTLETLQVVSRCCCGATQASKL